MSPFIAKPPPAGQATSTAEAMATLRLKQAAAVGLILADEYIGGQILDPDNGKVYHSTVRLTDDGKRLSVRGYIGVPMLGRSQTWMRQE